MHRNLDVKRHELKYYISNLQYAALVERIKYILKPDNYSTPHQGYFIRSLYFDSHDDECLFDKQSGMMLRQKFRMRLYDLESSTVKFEIKNKLSNQIYKETASISRESAQRIIDGDFYELLRYENPILNKIYRKFSTHHYRPRVLIDYYRDAFVFDFFNVRITIDRDLHSNNTDFDIFSDKMHLLPVILEGKQILEIKYDRCLPEFIRRGIQIDSFERCAISKYTLGRRFFKTKIWEDY